MAIDCCKSYVGKQIIGLLPGGDSLPECLFYYSPNVPVGGYTVEGILFDQDLAINAVLNPLGIYYLSYYDITDNFNFVMTYVGSSQPTYIPQVEDSLGNPVTITWDSCCTKTCYEVTLNTDWTTDACKYFWLGLNVSPFFPDGFPLNDQATWQAFLEFFYGPQVVVTNTVTPTTVYLKIDNAYICDIPKIETQVIPSTDMTPCAPPEAKCFYFMEINPEVAGGSSDLFNWTINGHNMWLPGFINTFMQGIGGNGDNIIYTNGVSLVIEGAYLTYYGAPSTLPVFTILDAFGSDVSAYYNWTSYNVCTEQCFETTIEKEALYTYTISIDNTENIQLLYSLTGSGPDLDWSNPIDVTIFESLLQSLYGPQVIVTSGLTVSGDYKVNIYNINTNQITINHGTGGAYVNVMNNIGC